MGLRVVWYGTFDEATALTSAIEHNCECPSGKRCGAHAAMLEQRFLNGVLFARWLRERLECEEWIIR